MFCLRGSNQKAAREKAHSTKKKRKCQKALSVVSFIIFSHDCLTSFLEIAGKGHVCFSNL